MTIPFDVDYRVRIKDVVVEWSDDQASGIERNVSESIPDSSTDLEVDWVCDLSALFALIIVSDQDMTLKTNDAGAPIQTFLLKAGEAIPWSKNLVGLLNPITTDVTSIFLTNSSGSAANLRIRSLSDATP